MPPTTGLSMRALAEAGTGLSDFHHFEVCRFSVLIGTVRSTVRFVLSFKPEKLLLEAESRADLGLTVVISSSTFATCSD